MKICLSIFLLVVPFLYGHGEHNHEAVAALKKIALSGGVALGEGKSEEQVIDQLVEAIHSAIESHGEAGGSKLKKFIRGWLTQFNFKQTYLMRKRIAQMTGMGGENPIVTHIRNFSALMAISHTVEVLSGPSLLVYGTANGWPSPVLTAIGVVGGIISIPFFADPLCIALIASYKYSKKFRRMVTVVSAVAIKAPIKILTTITGMKWLFRMLTRKVAARERVAAKFGESGAYQGVFRVSGKNSQKTDVYVADGFDFLLRLREGREQGLYLDQVVVDKARFKERNLRSLKRQLRVFGWDIKDAILGLHRDLRANHKDLEHHLTDQFFVHKVSQQDGSLVVKFIPEAVRKNASLGLGKAEVCP